MRHIWKERKNIDLLTIDEMVEYQKSLFYKWKGLALDIDMLSGIVQNPLDSDPPTSDQRMEWINKANNFVNDVNNLKDETLTLLQNFEMVKNIPNLMGKLRNTLDEKRETNDRQ